MEIEVRDSNGTLLKEGDIVTVNKDLKVRGSSGIIKRGTTVKNIKLTDDPEEVEGKVEKQHMVLKACFLKKA
jgi:protein PhnA